jgi:hypothetical protein
MRKRPGVRKARRRTATPKKPPPRREGDRPPLRYMTVIAQDPSVRRSGRILTARVAVPAEDLVPGPMGYRVQVVDYDATERRFYGVHDLPARYEDEPRRWQDGDPRIVKDYRFHAQNVYALVMKTLARFEFALGRRVSWSFDTHQIKVAPHGMRDANAFYSPTQEGLVFGYFEGQSGSQVFTALSHDVVVHEATHALLDALRERYLVPSNPDQAAFHEGLGDVVALLSIFALPEVVGHLLQPSGGNGTSTKLIGRSSCSSEALRKSALFGLADEMGQEINGIRGEALRKSAELKPDRGILKLAEFEEPHRRGEVFVAAVMGAFIAAWSDRILKSGTPNQKQFPVARVAEEGADIADELATLWIRAIDYMPPVHLTFSDTLTAALTSDTRVRPDDSRFSLRHHLKRAFAAYGIRPAARDGATDCWSPPPEGLRYERVRFDSLRSDKDEVFRFLWENRDLLGLRTDAYTQVLSVRPCIRVAVDGFVLRETVSEYYQVARLTADELASKRIDVPAELLDDLRRQRAERNAKRAAVAEATEAGTATPAAEDGNEDVLPPLYGGGVLIFDEYGRLKYHIHNDVFGRRQAARLEYLWNAGLLRVKAGSAGYRAARLSTLHRLRAMDARKWPAEGW